MKKYASLLSHYLSIYGQTIPVAFLIMFILTGTLYAQNTNPEDAHFTNLNTENGLPTNVTYDVIQDSRGFIWITSASGLVRHDAHEIRIFQYDPNRADSLANNRVNKIFEDNRGNLWVETHTGLDRFDRNQEAFEHFKHDTHNPNSLSGNNIQTLFEDRSGTLWIGNNAGLDRMTMGKSGVFNV